MSIHPQGKLCSDIDRVLAVNDPAAWPDVLELRGEVHIRDDDFSAANEVRAAMGLKLFKSARNAAAGAMR